MYLKKIKQRGMEAKPFDFVPGAKSLQHGSGLIQNFLD